MLNMTDEQIVEIVETVKGRYVYPELWHEMMKRYKLLDRPKIRKQIELHQQAVLDGCILVE